VRDCRRASACRLTCGLIVLVGILLVAGAPYLARRAPFRDRVLAAALPKLDGTVSTGGASLGWFSPVEYRDLEIRRTDGVRVIAVAALRGARPLWKVAANPFSIGDFRVEGGRLEVAVTPEGTNFDRLVIPPCDPIAALGLEIVDGVLSIRGARSERPWDVGPANVRLHIEPRRAAEDRPAELTVQPGVVMRQVAMTPQMCADLLKYLLPVVAEASEVSGRFSLEIDGWRIPLDEFGRGEGSGRLVIHHLDVAQSALVQRLGEALGLAPTVRLAETSTVPFRMADGRLHHRDLRFGLRNLTVCTRGSVGLDQSLDLVAEIGVPNGLLGNGPLAGALKNMALPIRGTLGRPQIDLAALGITGQEALRGTLGELLKDRPVLQRLLRGRTKGEGTPEKPSQP